MPKRARGDQPFQVPRRPNWDPSALAKLLDGWMRDDEAEQRETFEALRRSLDEDRPEGYKLLG